MSRSRQCIMKEIKPVTLSCISSSSQLSREKKAFFKGKVRKIGQYIFLLHNRNSYRRSGCKVNTKLAFHHGSRLWQALGEQNPPACITRSASSLTGNTVVVRALEQSMPQQTVPFATGRVTEGQCWSLLIQSINCMASAAHV